MLPKPNRHYNTDVVPFATKIELNNEVRECYLYIYSVKCIPTGQVYIGQRMSKCEPIFDTYKGSGFKLKPLKRQYQWYRDFDVTILKCCNSIEELNEQEKLYIQKYKNDYKQACLNVMEGGQLRDRRGTHLSVEQLNALRASRNTPEYRSKMSEINKHRWNNMSADMQRKSIEQLHKGWRDPERRSQLLKERREEKNSIENKLRISKFFKDKWANDLDFQEKMRIKNIQHSEFMKQYSKEHPEHAELMAAKRRRKIKVLNTFTSPKNGALIEKDTIFSSITELCKAIGFANMNGVRSFSSNVMNNKQHPGVWTTNTINGKCYGSKRFYIATFEYLN